MHLVSEMGNHINKNHTYNIYTAFGKKSRSVLALLVISVIETVWHVFFPAVGGKEDFTHDTVDGRNPAPPGLYKTL